MRGGRGVASRLSVGLRRNATDGPSALLCSINNLLLEFDCLLLDLRHGPRQRHVHVGVCIFRRQRVVPPVNDDLTNLTVLLNIDDYMSAEG